jgi:hypothetical protein
MSAVPRLNTTSKLSPPSFVHGNRSYGELVSNALKKRAEKKARRLFKKKIKPKLKKQYRADSSASFTSLKKGLR